jgi:hypothetical protein
MPSICFKALGNVKLICWVAALFPSITVSGMIRFLELVTLLFKLFFLTGKLGITGAAIVYVFVYLQLQCI